VRAGEVVVANAPGAGWLESPGLAPSGPAWPSTCWARRSLPASTAWWCGEASAWRAHRAGCSVHRRAHLRGQRHHAQLCAHRRGRAQRGGAGRAGVRASRPTPRPTRCRRGCGRPSSRSGRGALEPRVAVLRVYALTDGRGGWQVLPGG
jgi:hypothetical protein